MFSEDTICAPATSPLNASIAVIRVSGPESRAALNGIFSRPDNLTPRRAVYGSIHSDGRIIDDVIAVYFESPKSFTGEEMAEIYCHGNPIIIKKILRILGERGVRLAGPGEFSMRAYMNGKIDLTEAEAINHIVRARSDWEIEAALGQMHGSLKESVYRVRDSLIGLRADIECGIDFIEEEIEFISRDEVIGQLDAISALVEDIIRRCRVGEQMMQGIDIPIVGKPNVGKSSILNMILNSERAIVSDIPGTTRDLIKETIQFAGIHVNLFDTAGIDEPGCEIERIGIELSRSKIESASIVLFVIDALTGLEPADIDILDSIARRPKICLANKIDLVSDEERGHLIKNLKERTGDTVLPISAKTGEGLDLLEAEVARRLTSEYVEYRSFFISDIRVTGLLERATSLIAEIRDLVKSGEPPEILAFEIQELIDTLMEITGEITPDDVLNSIFSRFCIGK